MEKIAGRKIKLILLLDFRAFRSKKTNNQNFYFLIFCLKNFLISCKFSEGNADFGTRKNALLLKYK